MVGTPDCDDVSAWNSVNSTASALRVAFRMVSLSRSCRHYIANARTCSSKSHETRGFDRECLIDQRGPSERRARVASVAVDDEQLAAGRVFPTEPSAGGQAVYARVVLHQATEQHSRRRHHDKSGI